MIYSVLFKQVQNLTAKVCLLVSKLLRVFQRRSGHQLLVVLEFHLLLIALYFYITSELQTFFSRTETREKGTLDVIKSNNYSNTYQLGS